MNPFFVPGSGCKELWHLYSRCKNQYTRHTHICMIILNKSEHTGAAKSAGRTCRRSASNYRLCWVNIYARRFVSPFSGEPSFSVCSVPPFLSVNSVQPVSLSAVSASIFLWVSVRPVVAVYLLPSPLSPLFQPPLSYPSHGLHLEQLLLQTHFSHDLLH